MRAYSTVFCILLYSASGGATPSLWEGFQGSFESKEHFHARCMDLWTRIDLVQAIATTQKQKEAILRELIKDLECLASFVDMLMLEDDLYFYKKLVQAMHCSFCGAFSSCKHVLQKKCLMLFAQLANSLEQPVNFKTDSAS